MPLDMTLSRCMLADVGLVLRKLVADGILNFFFLFFFIVFFLFQRK